MILQLAVVRSCAMNTVVGIKENEGYCDIVDVMWLCILWTVESVIDGIVFLSLS